MIQELKPHGLLNFFSFSKKNNIQNHIDLMRILSTGGYSGYYKLWFVCKSFGIHVSKDIIDGSLIETLFLEGKYNDIAVYNAKDAIATGLLYEKIKNYIDYQEILYNFFSSLLKKHNNKIRPIIEKLINNNSINKSDASKIIDWLENKSQITEKQKNRILNGIENIDCKYNEELLMYMGQLMGLSKFKFNNQQQEEDEIT